MNAKKTISVVVPAYNEQDGIREFYSSLSSAVGQLASAYVFEIVFVNDGSDDLTLERLRAIATSDRNVKVLNLSRNFGKEMATTAGLHFAAGDAVIIMDADGQHPVDLIPRFIEAWEEGAQVVVGVRQENKNISGIRHLGSAVFQNAVRMLSEMETRPGSTDFRLIDSCVRSEFIRLHERNRITRGLIDWLGYKRVFIDFNAKQRIAGKPTYSFRKLRKLAVDGLLSLSSKPLYAVAYLGFLVIPFSILLLLFMLVESAIGDPLGLRISGSAYIVTFTIFMVGILLVSQGVLSVYISRIYDEAKGRPLYVIDPKTSIGLEAPTSGRVRELPQQGTEC